MIYKTALLGAVALTCLPTAFADDTSNDEVAKTLGPIIIESSRLNQTLTEIGSSVDVITSADIEELGFDFAIDAIANAPSVTVNQNGGFGGQASVRIRGASSGQTLVMIDGVPVGDVSTTDGSFNFARLGTESIERIEILKGAQSTLWGTDAIGGVISITTKTPDEGFGGDAYAEIGSFETVRGGAAVEYGSDKGDFRISYNAIDSAGISKADAANRNDEEDGFESQSLTAKGGFNFTSTTRLEAGLIYQDSTTEIDGYQFGAQGNVGDSNDQSDVEEISGHAKLSFSLFSDKLENDILVGYSNIDRENSNAGVTSFAAEGERWLGRYQGLFTINDANKLAFGLEHEEGTFDSGSSFGSDDGEQTTDSIFAMYELQPVESLTLTAGVRVDDHDAYGTQTTGRVAAAYNPNDIVTLRASWGQGFKAPSLYQLYSQYGTPTLSPEESEGFDVGLDLRTPDNKGTFGVTYFDQEVTNQIDFSFATFTYDNIAKVNSSGVEVSGSYQLLNWLGVNANYAYIDAEDDAGEELVRIPEHSGDFTMSFTPEGPFSSAILVRYNGSEEDRNGKVDAWTRVDLSASYDVTSNVEVYTRIENLFDEEYQQILGYGTPGISGSFGLRLSY
ncbi:TonB-dependent receptor plug domain-containing protein [Hirschia litorea]|uniref:TonB-dependent receptor plug domain-containing protein n=1 Tax=Hirschia litorea TaxID=1199156 RepID=A0ABW2IHM7_9PROT